MAVRFRAWLLSGAQSDLSADAIRDCPSLDRPASLLVGTLLLAYDAQVFTSVHANLAHSS
jgi:uncharacterized protein YceK